MNKDKYVDESWKEQASQEKNILKGQNGQTSGGSVDSASAEDTSLQEEQPMEVNFLNYITSLGFQAMIFLGEIPNPMTNKTEKNIMQAKFLIDTLSMLKEKTSGNLNEQEKSILENSVYELQLKYVQVLQQDESGQEGKLT